MDGNVEDEVAADQAEFDALVLADWQRQLSEAGADSLPPPPAALHTSEQIAEGGTAPPPAHSEAGAGDTVLHTGPQQPILQPENVSAAAEPGSV